MAHYWGKFVPSVIRGLPAGEWEHFRNAENPARELRSRARDRVGKFFTPTEKKRVYPIVTEERVFVDADQSAMLLIWLCRDEPAPDKAPDEVWHLTNRFGLIRATWSSIMEDVGDEHADEDELDDPIREPSLDDHLEGEMPVISWADHGIEEIWRPPSLEDLAERKVVLIGDKRPLTAGAYSERQVERPRLRGACPDCGVKPSPFTLECKC
jgi:hypothetical protein